MVKAGPHRVALYVLGIVIAAIYLINSEWGFALDRWYSWLILGIITYVFLRSLSNKKNAATRI